MPYPVFSAGQTLTAGQLAALQWTEVIQGTVLTVNNSTTFVDSNIVVPTLANARYRFELLCAFTSSPAVKFRWDVPSGGQVDRYELGPGSDASGGSGSNSTVSTRRMTASDSLVVNGATNTHVREAGVITGGASDGDVTLQFAQNSAIAADSDLSSSTRLFYIRID